MRFDLVALVVAVIGGVASTRADFCNSSALAQGAWTTCDASGVRYRIDHDWMCLPGINVPLRVNPNNDVECMSLNHHDCMWQKTPEDCQALLPKSDLPVRCSTGDYNNPDHWCAKSHPVLQTQIKLPPYQPEAPPSDWKCIDEVHTPLRLNARGDVECMSLNNQDCLWRNSRASCQDVLDASFGMKPLACGDMTMKEWGFAGYDRPDHWCAIGRSMFAKMPPSGQCTCGCDATTMSQGSWSTCDSSGKRHRTDTADQWHCYPGIGVPLRLNKNNDIECMSMNARDCLWTGDCNAVLNTHPGLVNPLVCGAMHASIYGGDGYSSPGHWCNTGRTLAAQMPPQQTCACQCDASTVTSPMSWTAFCDTNGQRTRVDGTDQWKCYPGIGVPLRMNQNGDVECMATNAHDCMWTGSCTTVLNNHPAQLNPLACGAMHLAAYGGIGYDSPGHWCASGLAMMTKLPQGEKCTCGADQYYVKPSPARDWNCYPGINVPIRLNANNDVECMSTNHHDCLWTGSSDGCMATLKSHPPLDPLACGDMCIKEWGITGYDTPGHWCTNGRDLLSKLL